ncbi:shikimate 5-dehydrogenase [Swaminathania salitolerans LMG 21291]|uniref:Shikimate dehydrogenase (NADP(+)) n=1 Tax=Swaminathania salitolerans TaxID=182838 RepID=A0A511BMP0_9PROT|nr:shikimate 5-dehydrogenase [Swaminathania salitolerans LMG 21291]GEL01600.1 shikimate dehydrogenase (NADP(+)) [Swaminathania salitolerans]
MGTETGAAVAAILARCVGNDLNLDAAREALAALFPAGIPRLAAVTGWPLTATRSPLLHNYWCDTLGIEGLYCAIPLPPEAFERGIRTMQSLGFRGSNVTIPHKEAAFALVDRRTRAADRAGAVNTLIFEEDGTITGDCTDGTGYLASLSEAGIAMPRKALVLGAGGASRAICAALLDSGCSLLLANRTTARAAELVEALGGGTVVPWERWPESLPEVSLLVNTTALGMGGQGDYDWSAALGGAAPDLAVSDIVYMPLETPLLAAARARGLATVDGLGMLIHQARPGFAAWFGRMPGEDPAGVTEEGSMAALRARVVATLG